jgi:Chromosome segregation ATPases
MLHARLEVFKMMIAEIYDKVELDDEFWSKNWQEGVGYLRYNMYFNLPNLGVARDMYVCMFLPEHIVRAANHRHARELNLASGIKYPYRVKTVSPNMEDLEWVACRLHNYRTLKYTGNPIRTVLQNKARFEHDSLDSAITTVLGEVVPVKKPKRNFQATRELEVKISREEQNFKLLKLRIDTTVGYITRLIVTEEERLAKFEDTYEKLLEEIRSPDTSPLTTSMIADNLSIVSKEIDALRLLIEKAKKLVKNISSSDEITSLRLALNTALSGKNVSDAKLECAELLLSGTKKQIETLKDRVAELETVVDEEIGLREEAEAEVERLNARISGPGNDYLTQHDLDFAATCGCSIVLVINEKGDLTDKYPLEESAIEGLRNYIVPPCTEEDACLVCSDRHGVLSCGNSSGDASCVGKYCRECFYRWFVKKNACPQCRKEIIPLNLRQPTAEDHI